MLVGGDICIMYLLVCCKATGFRFRGHEEIHERSRVVIVADFRGYTDRKSQGEVGDIEEKGCELLNENRAQ